MESPTPTDTANNDVGCPRIGGWVVVGSQAWMLGSANFQFPADISRQGLHPRIQALS